MLSVQFEIAIYEPEKIFRKEKKALAFFRKL